jgi:regulator of protease activity HflC (stomatin/prohibitin superfamily)
MSLIFMAAFIAAIPFCAVFALHQHNLTNWKYERRANNTALPEPQMRTGVATIISAALVGLMVLFESYVIIPAAHIGVQVTFGEVQQHTLSEGLHFVNPMSSVRNVEVRMVSAQLKGASAGTKDLQQVHTDIVLNYRLDGTKAAHIYKEYGFDLQDKVILPALNESFKAVTAHYSSEELITKRDEVSAKIKEEVGSKLGKYNIGVSDISLVNFGFSAEYQKAIEAKVIATQSKLQAEQDLARIEVEAKQAVAKAEGRAKAIQIETAAINSQGGASYVQLKAIEKWDGKLPTTQAGGATPFINLK